MGKRTELPETVCLSVLLRTLDFILLVGEEHLQALLLSPGHHFGRSTGLIDVNVYW